MSLSANTKIAGPGTGMALASGIAAHGIATGGVSRPGEIISWFIIATIVIEVMHLSAPVVKKRFEGESVSE